MNHLISQIAEIAQIPVSTSWQIEDADPGNGLYLLHYTDDASMPRYGSIRGLVVDVPNKRIVSRPIGYMPIAVTSSIQAQDYDSKIHLHDSVNPDITFTLDSTTRFYPGFDGLTINLFLHHGHVHYGSSRSLDSVTLRQVYTQLGGPSDQDLFDLTKETSPIVHSFILSHPSLQIASKTPVGAGYLVYLGSQRVWTPIGSLVKGIDTYERHFDSTTTFIPNPTQPILYSLPAFSSITDANRFLNQGFYPDQISVSDLRLSDGEFVIANLQSSQNSTFSVVRIESPAYRWRSSIRDNNLDVEDQFYILTNGQFIRAEYEEERKVYEERFPFLLDIDDVTVEQMLPDPDLRLRNIFYAYIQSLPPSIQDQAVNLHRDYVNQVTTIIPNRLIQLHIEGNVDRRSVPSRGRQIILRARDIARTMIANGNQETFLSLVEAQIHQQVMMEEGGSLYRLVNTLESQPRDRS